MEKVISNVIRKISGPCMSLLNRTGILAQTAIIDLTVYVDFLNHTIEKDLSSCDCMFQRHDTRRQKPVTYAYVYLQIKENIPDQDSWIDRVFSANIPPIHFSGQLQKFNCACTEAKRVENANAIMLNYILAP